MGEGVTVDENGTPWVHKDVAEGDEDRGGWHRDEEIGGDRVKAEMGQHGMRQAEHRRQRSPKQ